MPALEESPPYCFPLSKSFSYQLDILLAADNAIMQLAESGLDSFPHHFFVFIPVEDFIDQK